MRRRVTFSRNLTLSLSRTCRCYCKYCAFATHTAHLYSPEEVLEILDGAARRRVKELLVLTGERPEVNPEVARAAGRVRPRGLHRLRRLGLRAGARAGPVAAHEPRRARARGSRAAARGDRLAGADARVGGRAADGDGARRLADQASGPAPGDDPRRGRAEDPVHERHPRRHRRDRAGAHGIAGGAGGGARRARAHPGGDPAELRPPPALLRTGARADRRRGRARLLAHGRSADGRAPAWPLPEWTGGRAIASRT